MKNKDIDLKDCFAFYETTSGEKYCSALKEKNCENCNFYRNDIKRADIEKDVKSYNPQMNNYKKWDKEKK